MNISIEDFKTGWFGINMGLTDSDIKLLIQKLELLRKSQGHFHLRRDQFTNGGGIADVELYWTDESSSNMTIE